MNDALAKRTDLVRAFIDERVHPAISGTENRDRFASLYRQRTRAKSWQLVNRANIKPFCGHGSMSSNDRERSDFCDVLVQVPLGARCTLGPRVLLQERSEEHTSELPSLMRSSYADFCLKKTTPLIPA